MAMSKLNQWKIARTHQRYIVRTLEKSMANLEESAPETLHIFEQGLSHARQSMQSIEECIRLYEQEREK